MKSVADAYADKNHAEHNGQRGNHGRHTHFKDFLDREVKSQREHKEHHSNVGPGLDIRLIDDRHQIGHVGRYEKSGDDIS